MNARPGEPDRQAGQVPSEEVSDGAPHDPSAATWVPPESPDAGSRPAWLPPGSRPGEPYGPPPGEPYSPPPGEPYSPPRWEGYGAPPPPWQQPPAYGQQPSYGPQPGYRKPRMPRWAKVVLIVGVAFYVLSVIGQLLNLMLIKH